MWIINVVFHLSCTHEYDQSELYYWQSNRGGFCGRNQRSPRHLSTVQYSSVDNPQIRWAATRSHSSAKGEGTHTNEVQDFHVFGFSNKVTEQNIHTPEGNLKVCFATPNSSCSQGEEGESALMIMELLSIQCPSSQLSPSSTIGCTSHHQ